jgi:two-component system, OmpR family, sensor kinase
VTVAILAIGLFAAGIGTMVFLRNTLLTGVDDSARQLVQTDVAGALFDVTIDGSNAVFTPKEDAVATDYFVAIYEPDGKRLAISGGDGAPTPDFPETFSLAQTRIQGVDPFTLAGESGTSYRAAVDLFQVPPTNPLYTRMVAVPTASVNRVVTSYVGIYAILAVLTIFAGALVTRWLVTLAFRSLGQVESTAMSIAAGDFSQRMTGLESENTEVGRLKGAINAMLARLDSALSQRDATVRQMRRFVGDASHELRTPLVTVRGYAELYRMGAIQGGEDTAQAMERIEKEAIRMGAMVEDLLALTRLDERRDEIEIVTVDLRPIARDAGMDLRATSPQRSITVIDTTDPDAVPAVASSAGDADHEPTTSPRRRSPAPAGGGGIAGATLSLLRRRPRPIPATQAPGVGDAPPPVAPIELAVDRTPSRTATPPIVLGDENRIRQVVANLLTNARRYTPEDSPIELRVGVDRAAGMGWIEVVDHGDGIPPQIREQIFQRFWRADTSRTRETGGSGLGLSIVASVVELLHGTVAVGDTEGGGATFRVAFPLAHERDAAEHLLIETQPLQRLGDDGI